MNEKIDKELGVVQDPLQQIDVGENFLQQYPLELIAEEDIETDYAYQRKQFYNLVEKGSTAIDGILEIGREGEHPRGYEVAGNLSNKSQKLPKN